MLQLLKRYLKDLTSWKVRNNKDKYYIQVCVCDEAGIKTIADNKVEPEIKKSL